MTPRSIAGYSSSNDFARQLAEHKRELSGLPPTKKFRSSAAPKGTKLGKGYQDRTSLRRADGEDAETQDDKEKRLKALEEMMKLQQIDQATFENLRAEIGVGGDVGSTHLIKGLDWKLLERVKRGEDVTSDPPVEGEELDEKAGLDVEDELESALGKEVEAVQREQRVKKGEMAPPPPTGGSGPGKMSRNEILQRMKASRAEQQEPAPPAEPALGDRFKKVGTGDRSEKKRFTEVINGRRREVLITVDKEGRAKRKVKWIDKEDTAAADSSVGEVGQQPLGMEIPAEIAAKHQVLLKQAQQADDEDDDIFAGIGTDYNPLADISDASDDEVELPDAKGNNTIAVTDDIKQKPRSYFATKPAEEEEASKSNPFANDPSILAALKRAAELRPSVDGNVADVSATPASEEQDPERALKRKQFLETLKKRDQEDAQDMDMGFGESRFGDEDDEDGPTWDEDGEGGKKEKGPRKRKKRRMGDSNKIEDVMSVLAGRQASGKK